MQWILQFPQLILLKTVSVELILPVKFCCNLRSVFKQSSDLFTALPITVLIGLGKKKKLLEVLHNILTPYSLDTSQKCIHLVKITGFTTFLALVVYCQLQIKRRQISWFRVSIPPIYMGKATKKTTEEKYASKYSNKCISHITTGNEWEPHSSKRFITLDSLPKDEAEAGIIHELGLPAKSTLCVSIHLGFTNFIKSKNLYWVLTIDMILGYML